MPSIHPISAPAPDDVQANFDTRIEHRWKVARATFNLTHVRGDSLDSLEERHMFSAEQIVDASLSPPELPTRPCTTRSTQAELRERARTDPEGADAEAISNMSRREVMATAINSAGFLCARVTHMEARRGKIVASCVEYRNGQGRVRYLVDAEAGTVEQLN